jgi:MFS family permease
MMALFFLGSGAACVLTGLATGPWSLALGLTLIGLFASIYHPVAVAWLVGAGDRPGRTLGINGVFGVIGTGGAGLIAGVLADLIDWRAAFLLPGLACILLGVPFTWGVMRGRHVMARAGYRPDRARASAADARRGLFLMLGVILFTGLIFQMASVGMPKIFQVRLGETIGTSAMARSCSASRRSVRSPAASSPTATTSGCSIRSGLPCSARSCCSPRRPSARCWWWS